MSVSILALPVEGMLNGANNISATQTIAATADCAVCFLTYDALTAVTIVSATYNGLPLVSQVLSLNNDGGVGGVGDRAVPNNFAQIFTQVAPVAGANTVAITFSAAVVDWYMTVESFVGVNQTTPMLVGSGASSGSNELSDASSQKAFTDSGDAASLAVSCSGPCNGSASVASDQTNDLINSAGTNACRTAHGNALGTTVFTYTYGSAGMSLVFAGLSLNGNLSAAKHRKMLMGVR